MYQIILTTKKVTGRMRKRSSIIGFFSSTHKSLLRESAEKYKKRLNLCLFLFKQDRLINVEVTIKKHKKN